MTSDNKKPPFSSAAGWFSWLHQELANDPGADQILEKMENRFGNQDPLSADDLLYWLYESIYSSMGWRKHHLEERDLGKADAELSEIEAASRAVEILKPFQKEVKPEQGSI